VPAEGVWPLIAVDRLMSSIVLVVVLVLGFCSLVEAPASRRSRSRSFGDPGLPQRVEPRARRGVAEGSGSGRSHTCAGVGSLRMCRPSMAPDSGRPAYVFNRPRRRPRPRIPFARSLVPKLRLERTICEAPASRPSRSRSFGDPWFPSGSLGTRETTEGIRARPQGRFALTPEVTGSRIDDEEDDDDDEDDEEGLPLSGVMLRLRVRLCLWEHRELSRGRGRLGTAGGGQEGAWPSSSAGEVGRGWTWPRMAAVSARADRKRAGTTSMR